MQQATLDDCVSHVIKSPPTHAASIMLLCQMSLSYQREAKASTTESFILRSNRAPTAVFSRVPSNLNPIFTMLSTLEFLVIPSLTPGVLSFISVATTSTSYLK